MDNETRSPAAAADAVSQVLDNGDLLIEILLRIGFPTTLVLAALVCKRWLGHVSDSVFLRRFRELHPPRLLGFYIEDTALTTYTRPFVPLLPQPPELAAVIRRTSFNLDVFVGRWTLTHDCRNGSVFCSLYNTGRSETDIKYRVHSPLCPDRNSAIPTLPQHHKHGDYYCDFKPVLSREESDGRLSYFYLYVEFNFCTTKPRSRIHVYVLQDGLWCRRHLFHIDQLPRLRAEPKPALVDNKIYMAAGLSNLIVLDLTTSSFSTIQLPQGVDHSRWGTTLLSRAHDASDVYLIHVKQFQLYIWRHKGDNWMLVDTICLRDMCANLRKSDCTIEDEDNLLLMSQAVDYCDFLFLKMDGCVLHLDIKCRTLRKVYQTKVWQLGEIHPLTMIWPPTFPALKYKKCSLKKHTKLLDGPSDIGRFKEES